jgi:hypothetical protein
MALHMVGFQSDFINVQQTLCDAKPPTATEM